jgi:PIN domain nuclease of toxin-antitoxin system
LDLLLDTHAFLCWISGDAALSAAARAAITDPGNTIFVSAASAWEIATKIRIGKLPCAPAVAANLAGVLDDRGFSRSASLTARLPERFQDRTEIFSIACSSRRPCWMA